MKNLKRTILMILALMTAICLSIAAFAEDAAEAPAAETASTDAAQASADALNEALTAYSNAKMESRKQESLDALKQELDSFVEAGKLTQEQADLILKYYTEQMALNGNGFGRGGKGMRNGRGTQPGSFGRNGRGGRFGNMPAAPGAVPDQPAAADQNTPAVPEGTSGT